MPDDDRPTVKQQRYLRSLAQSTGTSFTPPNTRREASAEIKRLKKLGRSPRHERATDREAITTPERGDQARVRDDEITGYGSDCQWSHQMQGE